MVGKDIGIGIENHLKEKGWKGMIFKDVRNRNIEYTLIRQQHIEEQHPIMREQIDKLQETLTNPDKIVRSNTDPNVELFYRHYKITPVTEKYFCIVVKILPDNYFIITMYFTDKIKRGDILWKRQ